MITLRPEEFVERTPLKHDTPLTITLAGTKHLVLMRLVLEDRFGNEDKAPCTSSGHHIHTAPGGVTWQTLQFDTAINALPGEYYKRVAEISDVSLVVNANALHWRARLIRRLGDSVPVVVDEAEGNGQTQLVLNAKLSRRPERFYLELSYTGAISIGDVAWTTEAPKTLEPLGVSITTYNKPDYLRPNLELLCQSASFKAGLLDVLVVNNGSPLENMPAGVEIQQMPNIGGTGGFLTGHAHFKGKGYRHFVIMDDDIAIPDDFIDRLYALSVLAKGYHIGTLAEILNTAPRVVKEQGGHVAPDHVFGLDLLHPMTDLASHAKNNLYGFYEVDFSGWWSLLVDLQAPKPTIPEKQFIKRDDIMFGYEGRQAGTPTIVFPNLIVAHGEEGAPTYFYYDIRNDLILRARNNDNLSLSLNQMHQIASSLMFTLKADQQQMFNQALAAFLAGPKALARSEIGKTLGRIRKMAQKPVSLPEDAEVIGGGGHPDRKALLRGFFRPRAWQTDPSIPIVDSNPLFHAIGRKRYFEPILYSKKGFLRERKLRLITGYLKSLWLLGRIAMSRKSLVRAYQQETKS